MLKELIEEKAGHFMPMEINLQLDGAYHRFRVKGEAKGKTSGWYCGGEKSITVGNWKTGEKHTIWFKRAQEEISGKEANKPPSWIDARKTYYRLKNNREIFPAETPKYLKDKGFNEEGMLTALTLIGLGFINLEGVVYLIIPVMKYGEVYGGQLINMTSGEKRYLKGTNKEGGYYELSNFGGTAKPAFEGMTVKIGEGFATCYSVLKISLPGQRVLMAFDKGNMRKVGARLQESKIIYIEDV